MTYKSILKKGHITGDYECIIFTASGKPGMYPRKGAFPLENITCDSAG
jgi:hypothetical protein